ncbi:MAG: ATP-binding protein [Gemmatimonadaceae bacterium]
MTATDALIARLGEHRALGSAPVAEHAWLVEHGVVRNFAVGEVVTKKGKQAPQLLILFTGNLVIRMDGGAGMHKVFEWHAGDVGGVMPYSRGASPPNDVVAESPTEILCIDKEVLPEMIRECPSVTAVLVHAMVDRARQFTSNDLRDEKLVSLGKLAAGLAHELNNPASAVLRGAKLLSESIDASETAARRVGEARLTEEQFAVIDEIRQLCLKAAPTVMRTVMGRSDREDEFMEWLADHDVDERCAGPLAETGVTIDAVDKLADSVSPEILGAVIKWMAAGCNVRSLSADIEAAATRLHELVRAVKGFTYMDHARTPEPIDIRQGIADTLVMLASKIRGKSVEIHLTMADDLPRAFSVGAELNQIWMNLIDNAVDAVDSHGRVAVSATSEMGKIAVRVSDDGPGIPAEIVGRIFDPFFTTKGVGKGTGLGLDIVRRLLKQQGGELSVESVPGRTEFQVRLPVEP